jgi:hypothetical protein
LSLIGMHSTSSAAGGGVDTSVWAQQPHRS